jgi:hypothetical protein
MTTEDAQNAAVELLHDILEPLVLTLRDAMLAAEDARWAAAPKARPEPAVYPPSDDAMTGGGCGLVMGGEVA